MLEKSSLPQLRYICFMISYGKLIILTTYPLYTEYLSCDMNYFDQIHEGGGGGGGCYQPPRDLSVQPQTNMACLDPNPCLVQTPKIVTKHGKILCLLRNFIFFNILKLTQKTSLKNTLCVFKRNFQTDPVCYILNCYFVVG